MIAPSIPPSGSDEAQVVLADQARRGAAVEVETARLLVIELARRMLDPRAPFERFDAFLALALPIVQRAYAGQVAAGRRFFVQALEMAGYNLAAAPAPELECSLPVEQVATSLKVTGPVTMQRHNGRDTDGALALSIGLASMGGAAKRLIVNGHRDAVIGLSGSDDRVSGWMRVTDGDPCGFCASLAGTVNTEYGRRSRPSAAFRAHDSCGCTARPVIRPPKV